MALADLEAQVEAGRQVLREIQDDIDQIGMEEGLPEQTQREPS
jgi:hypothetical protein